MNQIAQPSTTVNINSANLAVVNQPQKILVVGPQLSGTAVALDLTTNIQTGAEDALYGATSIIANMIRNLRKVNDINQVDAVGVADDGAGVAATGTITITGTATGAGTLTIIVGSESDYKFDIAVAVGDTPTVIGDAIVAAANALTNRIMSAANAVGVVTFTALNKGTIGNSYPLQVTGEDDIAGVATAVVTMASGATDPTLTTVFDNVGEDRYQGVVWGFAKSTSEVITFMDSRFNVTNDVLNGVAFTADVDTLSNLTTAVDLLNSESLSFIGFKKETEDDFAGPSLLEPPVMVASQFAGLRSRRFTEDEPISDIVITSRGALDSFGGAALASKPYFNTPFADFFVIKQGRGWTRAEIETLLDSGVSVIGNNRASTEVVAGEQVTTYKTDSGGNPDTSFKFVNFVDTASGVREYFVNNLNSRFAQSRLTEGDLVSGRDQVNEQLIRSTLIEFYNTLSGPQFVLTQAGETALQTFKDNLSVVIDLSDGSATINMKTPLVTQLRTITATMTIVFSPNG